MLVSCLNISLNSANKSFEIPSYCNSTFFFHNILYELQIHAKVKEFFAKKKFGVREYQYFKIGKRR